MNKKEILRYLKVGKAQPSPEELQLIDDCIAECVRTVIPRSIYRIVSCKTDETQVYLDDLLLRSRFLAKNLEGCQQAVVLAATLGPKADLMIRQSSVSNMAKAAVLQSVFAQQIEEYIDTIEAQICADTGVPRLRPRFSPGYADLPLEAQKQLFAFLEISKRIGVTLTESCLMIPTKSVTALIGIPNVPHHIQEDSHEIYRSI